MKNDFTLKSMLGLINNPPPQIPIVEKYAKPKLTPIEIAEAQAIYNRPQKMPDAPPQMQTKKAGWGAA